MLLSLFNKCLLAVLFPSSWQTASLVQISKSKGDPESLSAYGLLCRLDTAEKLMERSLKPRLLAAVKNQWFISSAAWLPQGHSTSTAITEVIDTIN